MTPLIIISAILSGILYAFVVIMADILIEKRRKKNRF